MILRDLHAAITKASMFTTILNMATTITLATTSVKCTLGRGLFMDNEIITYSTIRRATDIQSFTITNAFIPWKHLPTSKGATLCDIYYELEVRYVMAQMSIRVVSH